MSGIDVGWNGLELRHLVALVTVAEAGSFSRAAERLGYTQSAVSQQVAALERVSGAALFDRPGGPRAVELTEAGAVLVDHAHAVLARLRGAAADVAAVSAGDRGRLRVGTLQSVGTQVLPGLLRRFAVERPGVEIVLHESHDPAVLLDQVARGELDVTFCQDRVPEGFATRTVLRDPYVLLAPADSPEAARASISLADVAPLPLISYRNPSCLSLVVEQLAAIGAAPEFVFHSDDNSTIQGCVGAGIGYSLTAYLTVDVDDRTTVAVPIDPPLPPREIHLAWHAERLDSAALAAFVDAAEAVCTELSATWDRRTAA